MDMQGMISVVFLIIQGGIPVYICVFGCATQRVVIGIKWRVWFMGGLYGV